MALKDKDKIKDLFSSKLQNFEPEVPASFWAGIDQSLPQQPPSSPSISPSTTSKILWMKPLAAVASAVAISVSSVFVYNNYIDEPTSKVETVVIQEDILESDTATVIEEVLLAEVAEVKPTASYRAAAAKLAEIADQPTDFGKLSVEVIDTVETSDNIITKQPDNVNVKRSLLKSNDMSISRLIKPRKGFTLGVSSNLAFNSVEETQRGGILTFADPDDLDHLIDEKNMNVYRMEHDQPISFGLSVSKDLSPNLSIETGIIYTYVSSTIKSDSSYLFREKQSFHYLGIPISLNYTFLKYKKLKAYISVGGMIQKDVKGSYSGSLDKMSSGLELEPALYYGSTRVLDDKKNISQSNPQFSGHLNLGLSYPVYKKLYLYGKIGGAYYFNASNKYRTIYSDDRIQLDLNLGLKWNF